MLCLFRGVPWVGSADRGQGGIAGAGGVWRGAACPLHVLTYLCGRLFFSQRFLGLSQTLNPVPLGSPSKSLAMVFLRPLQSMLPFAVPLKPSLFLSPRLIM